MKGKLLVILALAVLLAGCASNLSTTQRGALYGGAIGSAIGVIAGSTVGEPIVGLAIGGTIGALGGAVIGDLIQNGQLRKPQMTR